MIFFLFFFRYIYGKCSWTFIVCKTRGIFYVRLRWWHHNFGVFSTRHENNAFFGNSNAMLYRSLNLRTFPLIKWVCHIERCFSLSLCENPWNMFNLFKRYLNRCSWNDNKGLEATGDRTMTLPVRSKYTSQIFPKYTNWRHILSERGLLAKYYIFTQEMRDLFAIWRKFAAFCVGFTTLSTHFRYPRICIDACVFQRRVNGWPIKYTIWKACIVGDRCKGQLLIVDLKMCKSKELIYVFFSALRML